MFQTRTLQTCLSKEKDWLAPSLSSHRSPHEHPLCQGSTPGALALQVNQAKHTRLIKPTFSPALGIMNRKHKFSASTGRYSSNTFFYREVSSDITRRSVAEKYVVWVRKIPSPSSQNCLASPGDSIAVSWS